MAGLLRALLVFVLLSPTLMVGAKEPDFVKVSELESKPIAKKLQQKLSADAVDLGAIYDKIAENKNPAPAKTQEVVVQVPKQTVAQEAPKKETVKKQIEKKIKENISLFIRNELGKSIRVGLSDSKSFYLDAYQTVAVGVFESGDYKFFVYDALGELLGIVYKSIAMNPLKRTTLVVNSFKLRNDIRKNILDTFSINRKIKVINKTDYDFHVDIIGPAAKKIGKGWTIRKGMKAAQSLLLGGTPVTINPNWELHLAGPYSDKKFAKDLSIDEDGAFLLDFANMQE